MFFKKKPAQSVEVIQRDPCRLTLNEWRQTPELVEQAQKALMNPTVRLMLDVLRTEHLGNYMLMGTTSLEDRAIVHAKCEGYSLALNNLESLAKSAHKEEAIEATFES